ncbi:hypothetical protein TNCV_3558901 [Trichonephila clavipes]|uniref:Uncharacterized protein n=1 Tax=Trichonephila clavipes TaxID=2585209 RepID=A0A8X6WD51_TRICX|nr:hypothetical protein TNCV_3558901 [Trichonephila clavipes]
MLPVELNFYSLKLQEGFIRESWSPLLSASESNFSLNLDYQSTCICKEPVVLNANPPSSKKSIVAVEGEMARKGRRPEFLSMHGTAHSHSRKSVDNDLGSENTHGMDWPVISLDLNPIENFWDAFRREITSRHPHRQPF